MGITVIKKPGTYKPSEMFRNMKILIYGQPGAGKTYFIGSAANDPAVFGRILILSPDPGALTLAFSEVNDSQIEIAPITSTDDLDTWYEYLKVENPKLPVEEQFRTIALDSVTDINEMAMIEALAKTAAENPANDPDMPRVDHHQRIAIVTRREIRRFRDLKDTTFIATALEKTVDDTSTGGKFILPSLGGKLAAEAGGYFDIMGYLYTDTVKVDGKEKVVRKMRVQPNGKIVAKDRTRRLGTIIENPSLPLFVELIKNATEQVAAPAADPKIKLKTFTGK